MSKDRSIHSSWKTHSLTVHKISFGIEFSASAKSETGPLLSRRLLAVTTSMASLVLMQVAFKTDSQTSAPYESAQKFEFSHITRSQMKVNVVESRMRTKSCVAADQIRPKVLSGRADLCVSSGSKACRLLYKPQR